MHGGTFTKSIRHRSSFSKTIRYSPKTVIATINTWTASTNQFFWITFVNYLRPYCLIMMMSMIIIILFITIASTQIIIIIIIEYNMFWTFNNLMMICKSRSWTLLIWEKKWMIRSFKNKYANFIIIGLGCFFYWLWYFCCSSTCYHKKDNYA
jgi:hypothetical protein